MFCPKFAKTLCLHLKDAVILSSLMPFPPISWWIPVQHATKVVWDGHEHYQKMSRRSRYRIATASGAVQLSIPLIGGRDQRASMQEVRIDNNQAWQRTHWRTLTAAYRRAPFFEHYETSLQEIFSRPFELLSQFNLASVHWLKAEFGLLFSESWTDDYQQQPIDAVDLRDEALRKRETQFSFSPYTQVFAERHGFLQNLSALDLLFAGGPGALVL